MNCTKVTYGGHVLGWASSIAEFWRCFVGWQTVSNGSSFLMMPIL